MFDVQVANSKNTNFPIGTKEDSFQFLFIHVSNIFTIIANYSNSNSDDE